MTTQSSDRLRRWWKHLRRSGARQYQRRLEARGWYALSERSEVDAVFVGGCGRSGTTLFRELLNRHPRMFCGPETSMFGLPFDPMNIAPVWNIDLQEFNELVEGSESLVAFAEAFFAMQVEQADKVRWIDKTPNNVRVIERLLTWFPNGRFIHLLRDGRDVACSLRHHPRERFVNGKMVAVKVNNPISACAERWYRDTSRGLAFRGHPRYLEVRYEDLVGETERELRRVCKFLGEEFTDRLLVSGRGTDGMAEGRYMNNANAAQPISAKSVGRWKNDLTAAEQQVFADVAGELLIASGYAQDHAWLATTPPQVD